MHTAPGGLSAVLRGSPRCLPIGRGPCRLERGQGGGESGLLLGRRAGKLDPALVMGPPVTLQGLLGILEPGPRDAPGEPERPEGRRQVPFRPGCVQGVFPVDTGMGTYHFSKEGAVSRPVGGGETKALSRTSKGAPRYARKAGERLLVGARDCGQPVDSRSKSGPALTAEGHEPP